MTAEKIYINNHSGMLESENYPNTTAYVREDIYQSVAHALEIEQDKNLNLRKGIESLQHQVNKYEKIILSMEQLPHYHDEQSIISKPYPLHAVCCKNRCHNRYHELKNN